NKRLLHCRSDGSGVLLTTVAGMAEPAPLCRFCHPPPATSCHSRKDLNLMSNEDLLARRGKAVPRGVASATPVFADRAANAEIWDVDGNRYVDFAGGIAVLNVGHLHPRVVAAVSEQLTRFSHTSFQVMGYESYVELAERLN